MVCEALLTSELVDEMRKVAHELEREPDEEDVGVQGGGPLVNFEGGVHTFQTPPQVARAPALGV